MDDGRATVVVPTEVRSTVCPGGTSPIVPLLTPTASKWVTRCHTRSAGSVDITCLDRNLGDLQTQEKRETYQAVVGSWKWGPRRTPKRKAKNLGKRRTFWKLRMNKYVNIAKLNNHKRKEKIFFVQAGHVSYPSKIKNQYKVLVIKLYARKRKKKQFPVVTMFWPQYF